MKIELEINVEELIALSADFCSQLEKGDMKFPPVKDTAMIEKLYKTGLVESGLIENEDGYWSIGRRDGDHVLIEYKPFD